MSSVIIAVAFANGQACPFAGQYLESFDFEADDGRGYGTLTPDISKAMKFPDQREAFRFWTRQPKCRPKREDGKPNRPLTSTTVEIIKCPAPAKTAPATPGEPNEPSAA